MNVNALLPFTQLFICYLFFVCVCVCVCSPLDPRVRDALAVYTDDWLVIQRK